MVKSGLEFFYFEILLAPLELLLPSEKNLPRMAELAWQVSLKGHVGFQNKKILGHFSPSFLNQVLLRVKI